MSRSQDFQVFVFLHIPWFTKLDQLLDIDKGNNFQECFEQLGGRGISSRSFSI